MDRSCSSSPSARERAPALQLGGDSGIYQDLPLSDDGSNIRILEVLPGKEHERIKCRLVVKQLSGTTRFEALSYTWGNLEEIEAITVNGYQLAVTANLERALRHLRRRTKRRRLWVDAACIDQCNLHERGVQVMHMGQIYRNAEQVLIWLGSAGKHTDLALRHIYSSITGLDGSKSEFSNGQCCPLHWASGDFSNLGIEYGFVCAQCGQTCWCPQCVRTRRDISAGLEDLIQREWWTRIWVVQEVAMAAGDPLVGCGTTWVAWSYLVKYEKTGNYWPGSREPIAHLQEIRLDIKKPPRLRDSMEPLPYSTDAAAADDVFHWLQRTASLHCRDPRDKVYALLGMARNKRWREFKPDYSISSGDLLSELVSQMITVDKNLDILTLCYPRIYIDKFSAWPWLFSDATPSWLPSFGIAGLPYLAMMRTLDSSSPLGALLNLANSSAKDSIAIVTENLPGLRLSRKGDTAEDKTREEPVTFMAAEDRLMLEVPGVVVDVVAPFSRYHKRLLNFSRDRRALLEFQRSGIRRALLEFRRSGIPDLQDLPLQALYHWAPVWRALDPAYMRVGEDIDNATLISDLAEYFRVSEALRLHNGSLEKRMELRNRLHAIEQNLKFEERVAAIERAARGRKYFVTAKGLLGIGSESVQPGDLVVMLNGSSAAYALRPFMSNEPQVFDCSLVGNVFVNEPWQSYPWPAPRPPSASWTHNDGQAAFFKIW